MSRKPARSTRGSFEPITLGQRLKAERERLQLSLADAAILVGVSEAVLEGYEKSTSSNGSELLKMFALVGGDIIYIMTGVRADADTTTLPPEGAILHALGKMPSDERRRLLIHLCTTELRWLISPR